MSTTRFTDAVTGLIAAYQAAAGLSGVSVYDGPQPSAAADLDFIVVGHDGSLAADGTLADTTLAGTYAQDWADTSTGQDEHGWVSCVAVSQTGDAADTPGRRARIKQLLAAAEDAAAAYTGAAHLTFDGTADGRFTTRQGAAGVAVICAYRVAYSAPWG